MQKTQAKEFFCLTEKDVSFCMETVAHACHCSSLGKYHAIVLLQLEPLAFEEKPNRRYKNATPTKLYSREEVSHLLPSSHAPL